MQEYRTPKGNIVRVHGEPNMDSVKRAAEKFLKRAEKQRREKTNETIQHD